MASKLRQTIPRRKAAVSLDNRTLKRSLAVHFQSYPLAFVEKEQLVTVVLSWVTMTPPNQQCPFWSCEILNRYGEKAEPIRESIWFRNTKCIQSDRSILGLSVQGLVSYIIRTAYSVGTTNLVIYMLAF